MSRAAFGSFFHSLAGAATPRNFTSSRPCRSNGTTFSKTADNMWRDNQRHVCYCQKFRQEADKDYPKWMMHNTKILGMAVEEIEQYSEGLRESGDPQHQSVAEVVEWLKQKQTVLAGACMLTGGKEGPECRDLDQLGRLVETLGDCAGVEDLVHILMCQLRAEKGGTLQRPGLAYTAPIAESTLPGHAVPTMEELQAIFNHMDANHDGRLNIAEFRQAMEDLGDPLSATSVQLISEAFDIHGSVEMEQFIAIVSAEEIRAHTQDSKVLRGLAAVARQQMEKHTPDWGS